MSVFKRALVERLVSQVEAEADVMRRAALATREAATHEDAKPENDKDTRSLEAAYLAGAQAERVRELDGTATALKALRLRAFSEDDPVALSAIAHLEADDASLVCFLAPAGGGLRAEVDGVSVQVVTPRSPLGQALVGQRSGATIEVQLAGKRREYTIARVE